MKIPKSGAELKALRQSRKLTQYECAELVYVTLNAWQKWERSKELPNRAAVELFCYKIEKESK